MTTITRTFDRTGILCLVGRRAFRTVFQPIVDLRTERIVGYEALTRFDGGPSTDRVFAATRRAGLGAVLEEAAAVEALRAAVALPRTRWVSLNLSPSTLIGSPVVRAAIRATGRPVVVELTEHEEVDDPAAVHAAIAELGDDVRLAMDDLGAGAAGIRHLVELRPAVVKIDRWLIDGVVDDGARQAMVAGLVGVVRSYGGEVVAEGIEHEEQVACLRRLGVGLGQGWALAHPQPAAMLAA